MVDAPKPTFAHYDRGCVANIVPAIFGLFDQTWLPEPFEGARAVVLLVLDGLGANVIAQRPELVPNLAAMASARTEHGEITTVVPATTSAALTSITTGTAPARHGIVGYRTFVEDRVLNVLRWQPEGVDRGPRIEPLAVQRQPAFRGRGVPVVTKSDFKNSGFTKAHLGDGPWLGWKTQAVLVEHVRAAVVVDRAPFVYAYYPGVDEVAHECGLHNPYYEAEVRNADALVGRVLDALPGDTALLVTADHGQTHIEADAWIDVHDLAPLISLQSGDARFRHLHARSGAAKELATECARRFCDVAWVRPRKELLGEGWLGPAGAGNSPAGARIGDVVLMPFAPVGFVDPALPYERGLRSAHGAPTADEMFVPLRAARGRAL